MQHVTVQESLDYHAGARPGKIEVVASKPLESQRHLSLAYTPGVADVVLAIANKPELAYNYTAKANLVAVISNGTAILGLGDRGPLAAKPVMEGKGVLFKQFADIDVFDIEVNSHDIEEMIQVVAAIAPTFGGINLEDIKAPECFEIETRLKAMLPIPVFHDDQHGTAIISAAALINALEVTGKDISDLRLVVSGAGASALACTDLYVRLGLNPENVLLVDSKGVVYAGREEGMNKYKARYAAHTDARTLADAVRDADVFLGLSAADLLTPEMVKTMAKDPIIFAMANPNPEIRYEVARAARADAIVATGRSDYPNQVNNVLGFPFIFRGALDVQASAINDEMKLAAARALARLAHEDVPDSVLHAYNLTSLRFGRDYLIPKPFDPRVLVWESTAVAEAAMVSGVARREIDLDEYREQLSARLGAGRQVRRRLLNKAQANPKRIVFAEGEEDKIIRAAVQVQEGHIGHPILIGRPAVIAARVAELGLRLTPEVIDPTTSPQRERLTKHLMDLRQRKGMTQKQAEKQVLDPNIFGILLTLDGKADAFLSGLTYEYPEVIRPALQLVGTRPGVSRVVGVYIVLLKQQVYVFTDATVNVEQPAETLAEAAILAADFAKTLDIQPRVALLSFSNFGSVDHPEARKVRQAVEMVKARRPDLTVDGEMQADTAVVPAIIEERFPFSAVQDANVLVFPNLAAANIAYKLLARLAGARTIGPVLLGVGKPVHVLQASDDVEEIVNMAAMAVVDAQGR